MTNKKLKTYSARWAEIHSANVEAENEDEAKEKILNSEFAPEAEAAEYNGDIEVVEIQIK